MSEESRKKNEQIIKATLKDKEELADDGWESVEEDVPYVQVDELKSLEEQLASMKIKQNEEEEEEEDEVEHLVEEKKEGKKMEEKKEGKKMEKKK